ncbi:hypothetical protein A1O1_02234 [Capronia coronata CBS 617.96]|uniref:Uncharacterized protein n=1 Tax=Capronia coronata CBS 617.96 TaxID=1182541 RepID=W9YX68_9EURO|nr:uncharacterized protein A1O1_02234 [Capronia coronata CBS 617.96]EXJ93841.1 hypothetical protein A1O1_02234 [Capronia coronata CBS 617.96]
MCPAKTKKSRAKASKPPTQKTIDCPDCGEAIIVPKKCKHGKNLIKCQGTGCSTAHITEHNKQCQPEFPREWIKEATEQTNAAATERDIRILLILQEIKNVEKMRGRKMKYLNGLPKADFLESLRTMGLEQARLVAQKLKAVAEGTLDLDAAMYDDEESEPDSAACQTPPEEEETCKKAEEDNARG